MQTIDMDALLRYRQERNRFVTRLGIALTELRPGYAKTVKTVTEEDVSGLGYAHGGVLFTMADSAAGSAACTYGFKTVTVDASFHYYRSAVPGEVLSAEASELKQGRTLCVYEVRVTNQDKTMLASGTFTFFLLPEKLDLTEWTR